MTSFDINDKGTSETVDSRNELPTSHNCFTTESSSIMNSESFANKVIYENKLLKCLSFNARSLKNKFAELHDILYNDAFDIICICETWLSTSVSASMLDPQGVYTVLRSDRDTHTTG